MGPSLAMNYSFLDKKMNASINYSLLDFKANGILTNRSMNTGARLSYTIKNHSFGLNYNYIERNVPINNLNISEHRATFNYSLRLKGWKVNFKKKDPKDEK